MSMVAIGSPATIARAALLAKMLLQNRLVYEVFLYGSLAREDGKGNDYDLIATVDEDLFVAFLLDLSCIEDLYEVPGERTDCACLVIGSDPHELEKIACRTNFPKPPVTGWPQEYLEEISCELDPEEYHKPRVDLWLMPIGWQEQADELQICIPLTDPSFVQNILRDARKFNPKRGIFESPGQ